MSGRRNQQSVAGAVAAFRQGDLARARKLAEEQIAYGQQLALLHHLLGLIDCRLGRLDSGIENLQLAVREEPRNAAYRVILARALIDAGRAREALDAAIPAPGTSAVEIDLWKVRAEAAFRAGDRATEADAWRAIGRARPNDGGAWTGLARSLFSQFRFVEAEKAYAKAL